MLNSFNTLNAQQREYMLKFFKYKYKQKLRIRQLEETLVDNEYKNRLDLSTCNS